MFVVLPGQPGDAGDMSSWRDSGDCRRRGQAIPCETPRINTSSARPTQTIATRMTGAVPLLSGDAVHLLPFHGQCVITVMGDGQGTPDAATELWTAYAAGRPDAAATGDTPEA